MSQSDRDRDVASRYVLDAMHLSTMSTACRIGAVAAMLKRDINMKVCVGQPPLETLASMLCESPTDKSNFMDSVLEEFHRQSALRFKRRSNKVTYAMGSAASIEARKTRIGTGAFGSPSEWVLLDRTTDDIASVFFGWFKRDSCGNLLPGCVFWSINLPAFYPAFVIKPIDGGKCRAAVLPEKAGSFSQLLLLLGLPMTFLDGRHISLDCVNRTFIVSRTNILPWTRY